MRDPGAEDDRHPYGEINPGQSEVTDDGTVDQIADRVEPERLGDHLRAQGGAFFEHGVELVIQRDGSGLARESLLDVAMGRQEPKGENQRVCRRLVAGIDQTHELIAQFSIAEALTIGGGGGHDVAEQVIAWLLSPICDDADDERVEGSERVRKLLAAPWVV
jgi:hypothetical protein